jgi:putative CocE/NonD family hydrolase
MLRIVIPVVLAGVALTAAFSPRFQAIGLAPDGLIVESGVSMKTRDGVVLRADVYRPSAEGRFPTLLQRTPYDRRGEVQEARDLAAAGYVVIKQDVRGRFDSQGEFYPFQHEADDGYDAVEWAASLPYSNGQVGMWGGSYVGATQMLAATAHPPHLVAIFPYVTASEYYEGWTYQHGALMQWFATSWSSGLAVDTVRRKAQERAQTRLPAWEREGTSPLSSYPLLDLPAPADLAPYFYDWIAHETSDDYWRAVKVSDHYSDMTVKALHAGGWHDLFLRGSIENYLGMKAKAATAEAREGQRLLLGPWAHAATSPEGKIGDVTFGRAAVLDMTGTIRRWMDYALKGTANEFATQPPVRIFLMGENKWRDETEFPPRRAKAVSYYLQPGAGRAEGLLVEKPLGHAPTQSYEYNPGDPVPTVGGRLCCGELLPPGPADQRSLGSRPDVLVFSTPPLKEDVEVTGWLSLELFASTSALDTDFTAVLTDVDEGGYARFLTDGIVRGRYRESTVTATALEPGTIYKFSIDLWATGNVFKAGHRIRLYVSSSNFPRFDRNRNTGEPLRNATRSVTAHQTVYHDAEHPSALVLPVVPR